MLAIRLKGFKSFRDQTEIGLRPLTILAGANSSGKSAAIQPLLLLKQTLEAKEDPGALKLAGPNVGFTDVSQVSWRARLGGEPGPFSIGLSNGRTAVDLSFERRARNGVLLSRFTWRGADGTTRRLVPRTEGHGVTISAPDLRDLVSRDENAVFLRHAETVSTPLAPLHLEVTGVRRDRCDLWVDIRWRFGSYVSKQWDGGAQGSGELRTPFHHEFSDVLTGIIHVPALYESRSRLFGSHGTGPGFPGLFPSYAASVIEAWQETDAGEARGLEEWLNRLGLVDRIVARRRSDAELELLVSRLPAGSRPRRRDLVSLADVGTGVAQAVPVVTSLLVAKPGQVVYLEEPETHLHPRAQAVLAQLLLDAAKRGVRVIVETHSEILLLGVQTAVAEGEADPALVQLLWFTRDTRKGFTTVDTDELNQDGRFQQWPVDFDVVTMDLQHRFLSAPATRKRK